MGVTSNDRDDVKVKGVDAGGEDREVGAVADGSQYRLMVDAVATDELVGSTLQSSGSVDVAGISFPAVAGNSISEFLIQCPEEQGVDNRLLISTNGVDFITLKPSGHLGWTPKGPITQLTIKSNTNGGVLYELIMNLGN